MKTRNLQKPVTGAVFKDQSNPSTIRDLVNTPTKKVVFVVLIFSIFLTSGGFVIVGTGLGTLLKYDAAQIAVLTSVLFVLSELFFLGSLAVLGKQVLKLVKDKIKAVFKRKKE